MNRPVSKKRTSLALIALLGILTISANAQTVSPSPSLISYQGRLTNTGGAPVANGSYSITFSLWDSASGGTQKWTQTFANQPVQNGLFTVLLANIPASAFNSNLWLQIQVGSDTLTPRQQLTSVPYAMKANSVPDGSIGAAQIADNSLTASKFVSGFLSSTAWQVNGNAGVTAGF